MICYYDLLSYYVFINAFDAYSRQIQQTIQWAFCS